MRGRGQMTSTDVLPDDVLLSIFDFYVVNISELKRDIEAWQSLVHVCRRWRCVVFGSPRRLNLRLVCTPGTPVRERLDVWPALPLIVQGHISSTPEGNVNDNTAVALEHSDRVCRINLRITGSSKWDEVFAAMQVPFPALTDLILYSFSDEERPIICDTFLGGSAPRLRRLEINRIIYPGISNLILSATHLVRLDLSTGFHSGYISPEEMANCLSVLTRLDTLSLEFRTSRSRRRLPSMTRSTLPCLTKFRFNGTSEYLDDFVARIDAPILYHLFITFLDQMDSETPHLVQFISRTPSFQEPNEAHVTLNVDADVQLLWAPDDYRSLRVEIPYEGWEEDPQPSSIAQICTMCLPPLPTVEILRIGVFTEDLSDPDPIEDNQWLGALRPFPAVKNLYLSEESAPGIANVLQELTGSRITEVLPHLQNLYVEGLKPSGTLQKNIGQYVSARQLSGQPIAISDWPKLYSELRRR